MTSTTPNSLSDLPLFFRPYDPDTDLHFVYRSWVNSYRDSEWAGCLPQHLSYPVYSAAITQLLKRGMRITMAVNPDDRDQILGFIAFEPGLLHYVFVKSIFRRQGVATSLMACANFDRSAGPVLGTFRTHDARHLGAIVFKPHLARRKAGYP